MTFLPQFLSLASPCCLRYNQLLCDVVVKPQVVIPVAKIGAKPGGQAELTCLVTGYPKPHAYFAKNSFELMEAKRNKEGANVKLRYSFEMVGFSIFAIWGGARHWALHIILFILLRHSTVLPI